MSLGEWYLSNSGGDLVCYHQGLTHGHRIGQAFFNALTRADQERLSGTLADPFHRVGNESVERAVEFLTRPDVAITHDLQTN